MSFVLLREQAAPPSTPASNKVKQFIDNSSFPRHAIIDDAGHIRMSDDVGSVAAVSGGYASDTYLAGSAISIPAAGLWQVGTLYKCTFDMVKTNLGTATPIFTVRMGTAGAIGDASVMTITFAAGTAAVDTGIFEFWINFRSIGSGTAAVIATVARCTHHLAATGLTTTGASGTAIITGTSSGFASTTQTFIGISFNGGASFSGTNTMVQSQIRL